MNIQHSVMRSLAFGLILILAAPSIAAADQQMATDNQSQAAAGQSSTAQPQGEGTYSSSQSQKPASENLPDSPSAASPASNSQNQPATQSEREQTPMGTAAAEGLGMKGNAGSRPAGNAIAPAKQRQTRSFWIKVGAVAAGGVALGTVMALSKGTSSKPPGAR